MAGSEISPRPRKRALLVGIDKYPLIPGADLRGCVNDAELMQKILRERFGFPDEDMRLLRDAEATRDGILRALDELVERAAEDEVVVFYYAGHGSRMTDREANKASGLDETLVPHDSGRHPVENRDITDDEMHLRLLRLAGKTRYTTLVFDCCHSATQHRDPFGDATRDVPCDDRSVDDLPPSPLPPALREAPPGARGASGFLRLSDRYVVVAGCRDEEKSHEHAVEEGGVTVRHGALTFFLARQLLAAAPDATWREVFERASAEVTAAHPRQHPQLEGARERLLFGVRDAMPMRHVPVERVMAGEVTLAAGAAHGLCVGSEWHVHPRGTREVAPGAAPLARLQVTSVGALVARARVLAPAAAVSAGDRAVEATRPDGERWPVQVVGEVRDEAVQALAARIAASPWLRPAGADEYAVARVTLAAADHEPARLIWSIVGRDGQRMMRPYPHEDLALVHENLEKLARHRQTLALSNPGSAFAGQLDLVIHRRGSDGGWVEASADPAAPGVFVDGEQASFEVRNRHGAPLYVTLLAFGMDAGIDQIHPPPGGTELLGPGQVLRVGGLEEDRLTVRYPEDLSFVPRQGENELAMGTDFIKLFASTRPLDLTPLLQAGLQATVVERGMEGELGRLLGLALAGKGARALRRTRVPPEDDWATEVREMAITRARP